MDTGSDGRTRNRGESTWVLAVDPQELGRATVGWAVNSHGKSARSR